MRVALPALLTALVACGPLTPVQPDGGLDAGAGGGATGGGATGGGGGATGGGGGSIGGGSGGGGVTGGGGGSIGGGSGGGGATGGGTGGGGSLPFTWSRMSFATAPGGTPTLTTVMGLARRASGEVWVGLSNSEAFFAAPGSDRLTKLPNTPTPTTSSELVDVAATDDEVFLVIGRTVRWCAGVCDDFGDFTLLVTVPFGENPQRVCTRGALAALTVQQGSTTLLYELDRTGTPSFTKTVPNLGVSTGRGCFISENGDVHVAGSEGVAVRASTGGTAVETVDLMGQANAGWWDVLRPDGTRGYLVGGGGGYRFARRNGSTWLSLTPNTAGSLVPGLAHAPAGTDRPEVVFACGNANGQTGSPWLYDVTDGGVTAWSPAPPSIDCNRALSAGANDVYFGGAERTGGGYVILHGRR